ncbi:MAG: hypothetical protein KAV87_36880, partial [Desulfobacteraceae bacterium]|nr:hypothetical protein [Desulfobacteraceae bacterium]
FEGFRNEVNFYNKYSEFYGYEFFVMQKNNQYKYRITNHSSGRQKAPPLSLTVMHKEIIAI